MCLDSILEIPLVVAVKHVRRMIGGSQSQMCICSDGHRYIVKFQNNPQGSRTLANDLLGTMLARCMGLPVAELALVEVPQSLVEQSRGLDIEFSGHSEMCRSGLCFGSRYLTPRIPGSYRLPGSKPGCAAVDYLRSIGNIRDFIGMLVFDKWAGNTDNPQVIFIRCDGPVPDRVVMIDLGSCFHAEKWDFPDHIQQGIFGERFVYSSIKGMEAFNPWLQILENELDRNVISKLTRQIPPEWYGHDGDSLTTLIDNLNQRRQIVRELLRNCCSTVHHSFRSWGRSPVLSPGGLGPPVHDTRAMNLVRKDA